MVRQQLAQQRGEEERRRAVETELTRSQDDRSDAQKRIAELARNQGRVLTREVLLDRVWGVSYYGDSRTLDVHIRRLRQKLGDSSVIETVTGIGYRLMAREK